MSHINSPDRASSLPDRRTLEREYDIHAIIARNGSRGVDVDYENDFRKAARRAERGLKRAIGSLYSGLVKREDDLSGVLKGNLDAELEGKIGRLTWECAIVDHSSGKSAEEKQYGADILIHVRFDGQDLTYDKGVLVQAKKLEVGTLIGISDLLNLRGQCEKMLNYSEESFVWVYSSMGMRCDAAQHVANPGGRGLTKQRDLNDQAPLTSQKFFFDLFRCQIGDEEIVSPYPADLRPRVVARIVGSDLRKARRRALERAS